MHHSYLLDSYIIVNLFHSLFKSSADQLFDDRSVHGLVHQDVRALGQRGQLVTCHCVAGEDDRSSTDIESVRQRGHYGWVLNHGRRYPHARIVHHGSGLGQLPTTDGWKRRNLQVLDP